LTWWNGSKPSHQQILSNVTDGKAFDDPWVFTVAAVQNPRLAGKTVIVNDDDPGIRFDNKWQKTRTQNLSVATNLDAVFPFGRTTHETMEVGSSFAYSFSGESFSSLIIAMTPPQHSCHPGTTVAIYGTFVWLNTGVATLSFRIDNLNQTAYESYRTNAHTLLHNQLEDIERRKSFKIFSFDSLPAGNHTLVVNMIECVNQTFTFDYLTYTHTDASYHIPGRVPSDGSQQMTKKRKIAIISGNVAGFVVLLLLLGVVFIVMRRRRSKYPRCKQIDYLNVMLLTKQPRINSTLDPPAPERRLHRCTSW